jgi:hypothetical protein
MPTKEESALLDDIKLSVIARAESDVQALVQIWSDQVAALGLSDAPCNLLDPSGNRLTIDQALRAMVRGLTREQKTSAFIRFLTAAAATLPPADTLPKV